MLTAAQIRQLPDDVCLVVYRNAKPMLVHLRSVWEVKDWKKAVLASTSQYRELVPAADVPADTGETKASAEPVRRWA